MFVCLMPLFDAVGLNENVKIEHKLGVGPSALYYCHIPVFDAMYMFVFQVEEYERVHAQCLGVTLAAPTSSHYMS